MARREFKENSLYLVTGENSSAGRTTLDVVEAAIRGGVDVVQMREKGVEGNELREMAERLVGLCRKNQVLFIVNDDPFLAKEIGADGVHLGQEDIKKCSLDMAREVLGEEGIIGLSTHSVDEARNGMSTDADYIAFGPVFPTKTKDYFIGKSGIPEVLKSAAKPVVFIGGINGENISEILSLGARNIAMIRYITEAGDVALRVRQIKEAMESFGAGGIPGRKTGITINGRFENYSGSASIRKLIEDRGLVAERLIVEHNSMIIPRDRWNDVVLSVGDNIEIVSFVGGG